MSLTPANAFGRLEMQYFAYGKEHVFRVWTDAFNADPGVGTFVAAAAPLSLDALATELSNVINPLYNSAAALTWGTWRGIKTTVPATGSGVQIVEGTIVPGASAASAFANTPGAVSQSTWAFRDTAGHTVRHLLIGSAYAGSGRFVYSSLVGPYLNYTNYVLASAHVCARSSLTILALIDITFDTNDGLTRRYRR